jgi:hypothetical protein
LAFLLPSDDDAKRPDERISEEEPVWDDDDMLEDS